MRVLVLLLLLANAILYGYFQFVEAQRVTTAVHFPELQPQKVTLLTEQSLANIPATPTVAATQTTPTTQVAGEASTEAGVDLTGTATSVCYEWGSFNSTGQARAENLLKTRKVDYEIIPADPAQNVRYWVYIPPRKSYKAAQNRVNQLKNLGINDSFVITDARWRNAISLGLFRDEALADSLLQSTKEKNIPDVAIATRNEEGNQVYFMIRNLPDNVREEIGTRKTEFSSSDIKTAACKAQ